MAVMNVKKIYANNNEQGMLVCEQCGKTKAINVSDYKNIGKPLKVKCSCGNIFFVSIETRKFYRKETNLSGVYVKIRDDMSRGLEKGSMTVEDLSRTGIGFRTKIKHNIQVQDVIRVKLILDDNKRSEVSKSVRVRQVGAYTVGGEFLDFDVYDETNRMLGLYLIPQ